MSSLTNNILDFYKSSKKNEWYLKKYFSNTDKLGYYVNHRANTIDSSWNGTDSHIATIDEYNTYNINSRGFRGEFDEDSTTIASGCSITFGIGVPESGRWTNLLGKQIDKNIINLGNPGGSVESICTNIIQYCMNNKMPKEIFCLFPDFFRSMVVVDKEFYKSERVRHDSSIVDNLDLWFCNPKVVSYKDSVFMEIKDKTNIEDATSPHQLILDAVNFIYILESFCLTNGIKLYWTTWDLSSSLVMQQLIKIKNFKLKNFTSFFPTNNEDELGWFVSNSCDSEHGSEFKDDQCWGGGSDYSIINYKKTNQHSHPGIHVHYHIADFFYNLYNLDNTNYQGEK